MAIQKRTVSQVQFHNAAVASRVLLEKPITSIIIAAQGVSLFTGLELDWSRILSRLECTVEL